MFFFKKQHYVEEQMQKYLNTVRQCGEMYNEALQHFFGVGRVDDAFLEYLAKTHKYEGIADDIRDVLETRMYEKSLIPESRGDVLAFIENLDFIPNNMENTVKFINEVNLNIPELPDGEKQEFKKDMKSLIETVLDVLNLALESGSFFFEDTSKVREYTIAIDRKESEADRIEEKLKKVVFRHSAFADLHKMLFYDLITKISQTADLCEKFQRRIIILSLKKAF